MPDFHYAINTECYIGPDTLFKLPFLAGKYTDRALLIADPNLAELEILEKIQATLQGRSIETILFDELGKTADVQTVENGTELARGSRAPLVIAIGGIRALHCAKAVACLAPGTRSALSWIDGEPITEEPLRLILMPTTLRDPFLLSGECILTDSRNSAAVHVVAAKGIEKAIIIDPNLSQKMSQKMKAASILDGMMSVAEGLVSTKANFYADLLLNKAMVLYVEALNTIIERPDDPTGLESACNAQFLAALGLATTSPGLGTALTYAINSRWQIPKANIATVVLPYLLEELATIQVEKIAHLHFLFGEEKREETADQKAAFVIESLRTVLGVLKIPSRLKDFELNLEYLVQTAEFARAMSFLSFHPRNITVDEIFDFIKKIY
ncbi:MAG TPA: iron-containing alcohol dehydrogenase [Spirochaetales bacterium]|nr:iron-containing alcohol dehydrogenase [Spirochaetales bacterium]HQK35017.1 iron-containing alcohol dehydrogenase [Spirochaetales bacterium]